MWAYKTILCVILFFGGSVFALTNPIVGVVLYVMVYQITPNDRWWGLPLADMGIRFSLLAGLFTIVGLVVSPHNVPRTKPLFTTWEWGLILLLGIAALTTYTIGIGTHDGSIRTFEKFWKMILFILVLNRLASTRKNIRIVLWSLVIGSLYLGYDAYTAPASAFWTGRLNNVGGPDFRTTSGLGTHLTAMLPLIGVLFLTTRPWHWRGLILLSGALSVNGIILCRTRSAFLGLLCGIAIALVSLPRGIRFKLQVCIIVGALAAVSLTDGYFWDRMATMSTPESRSQDLATQQRFQVWRTSMRIFADHPYGIGLNNFTQIIHNYDRQNKGRSPHNTFILCFVELGLPGGMVYVLMTIGGLVKLRRCARLAHLTQAPLETRLLIYGSLVSFVTYYVASLGTERLYCESFWWVLAMPQWLERMVQYEVEARTIVPDLARTRPLAGAVVGARTLRGDHAFDPGYRPRPALS
jgi:hypothetical protein